MRLPFFMRCESREEITRRMARSGLRPIWWPDQDRDGTVQIGDALLWRRPGLISWAGNGRHSHAGMVAYDRRGRHECLEVREFRGGRCTPLIEQVRQYPGRIDVFSPHMGIVQRIEAARYMRTFVGCEYGWWSVALAGLRHLPLVRWAIPVSMDDSMRRNWPPFCSEATAEAWRLGPRCGKGQDVARQTPDCYTEPSDIARAFRYKGTLVLSPREDGV